MRFPNISGLDGFVNNFALFRTCWLSGRWGGGKTALAVELALRLFMTDRVQFIVSNVPLSVSPILEIPPDEVPELRSSVIIMDEGWQYLESGAWKKAKDWIAFLRKRGQYVLIPSVLPLTTYVRKLSCERTFNGLPSGIPVWWYRYEISNGENRAPRTGSFVWVRPDRIFGLYDHKHEPSDKFWVYGTVSL